MDIATDGEPENILSLFKDNAVLKQELQYAMQHFISNTLICERIVSMMIKLIKADSNAGKWLITEETKERIKGIAEFHSNVVVIESKCNQLVLLMEYNNPKERRVKIQTPADVERSRHAQMRERENPGKIGQRAQRERTHIHPRVLRQSAIRPNSQFSQCNDQKMRDRMNRIEHSYHQPCQHNSSEA